MTIMIEESECEGEDGDCLITYSNDFDDFEELLTCGWNEDPLIFTINCSERDEDENYDTSGQFPAFFYSLP